MDSARAQNLSTPLIRAGLCLLVFLQYNDALLELIKPLPVFNLLSVGMLLLIVGAIRRTDPMQRLQGAWFVFVPIVAIVILSGFSRFYAIDTEKVTEDTVRMVKICLMVLILAYGVTSTRDLMAVIHAFIVAGVALGGFMILESFNGGPLLNFERHEETLDIFDGFFRSTGLSMESPPMAATMALCGATMSAVMFVRRGRLRFFYALGFLIPAAAVVASLTRSATLALTFVIVILIWRLRRRREFLWAVLTGLSVVFVTVVLLPPEAWTKLRLLIDPDQDHTIVRRLSYQIIGWDLFVQSPVFGVGSGNFNEHYASVDYRFVPGRGDEPRPLHNIYLQYLSELGVLGFALFIGIIGSVSRALGRVASSSSCPDLRLQADVLLVGFFSTLLQLFFLSSNFLFPFWAIIGLSVAVIHLDKGSAKCSDRGAERETAHRLDVQPVPE